MAERDDSSFAGLLGLGASEEGDEPSRVRARPEAGEGADSDRKSALRALKRALREDGSDDDLEDAIEAYLAIRER